VHISKYESLYKFQKKALNRLTSELEYQDKIDKIYILLQFYITDTSVKFKNNKIVMIKIYLMVILTLLLLNMHKN